MESINLLEMSLEHTLLLERSIETRYWSNWMIWPTSTIKRAPRQLCDRSNFFRPTVSETLSWFDAKRRFLDHFIMSLISLWLTMSLEIASAIFSESSRLFRLKSMVFIQRLCQKPCKMV